MFHREALIERCERCKRRLAHVRLGAALLEDINDRQHILALDGSLQLAERANRGLAHSAIEMVEALSELYFASQPLLILAR
eukprot:scaffold4911_cov65-Phaeocystis_antarctica.AAC.1